MNKSRIHQQLRAVRLLLFLAFLGLFFGCKESGKPGTEGKKEGQTTAEGSKETPGKVVLSPEALQAAGIEVAAVVERKSGETIRTTGTVEANQQQTQQVTPLVSGRIQKINVALGDRVSRGDVLVVMSSAEAAEIHGHFHAAETRLRLAEQRLARVQKPENRAGVLAAKARLDLAEQKLARVQKPENRAGVLAAKTRMDLAEQKLARVQKPENRAGVLAAKTRMEFAEQKLARVQKIENRAGVLAAKARLDETEATLRREKRLIELGAGAGKDLVAAETENARAKAEYDFQSNIVLNREIEEARSELEGAKAEYNFQSTIALSREIEEARSEVESAKAEYNFQSTIALNREIEEARSEVEAARAEYNFQNNIALNREIGEALSEVEAAQAEVTRLRSSLSALGVDPGADGGIAAHDTSQILLRAPLDGRIIERFANAGAGVEPAKPLFTISNVSSLWVIANVPEARAGTLKPGAPATIHAAVLGSEVIRGRVTYVDSGLNEETRTGKARIEIVNPQDRLKVGMFVEIDFEIGAGTAEELSVPERAIQRIGDRAVVFVPADESGTFEARDVELGEARGEMHQVLSGLKAGEKVVTRGSFVLKTQMLKGELGEE